MKQPECVLGVVGVAHVPGIVQCWQASTSSSKADDVQQSGIKPCYGLFHEDYVAQGVRRALLERFLELSCSAAVCADMQQQLPALPSDAEEAYWCTRELYGSPRMLLAALPRQYLDKASFSSLSHIFTDHHSTCCQIKCDSCLAKQCSEHVYSSAHKFFMFLQICIDHFFLIPVFCGSLQSACLRIVFECYFNVIFLQILTLV